MRNTLANSQYQLAEFEDARQVALQILAEEFKSSGQASKAHCQLTNAQYFIHQLYFYYGFSLTEIAEHIKIDGSQIRALDSKVMKSLLPNAFSRLASFYYAALFGLIFSKVVRTAFKLNYDLSI